MALVTDGLHVTLADWTERDGWTLDREDKAFGTPLVGLVCRYSNFGVKVSAFNCSASTPPPEGT